MAKVDVVYVPGDGDPKQTTWRGKTFYKGQPVSLDDEVAADHALIAAAKQNPSFNVGDQDKAADRAAAAKENARNAANMEIADIKEQGEAMKRRQDDEQKEMEARHKREQDDFDARMKPRMEAAQKASSGSDDSGAQQKDGDKEGRVAPPQTPTPVRTMSSPTPTTPPEANPAPVSPPPAPSQQHGNPAPQPPQG